MIGTLLSQPYCMKSYPRWWIENLAPVSKAGSQISSVAPLSTNRKNADAMRITSEYFRIRDFELVQPLYDLAFLLEIDALAKGVEIPKYRTFSLWRAGLSLDGYGTTIDSWLDGAIRNEDLDYVPSLRIKQYLASVRQTGTLPELEAYRDEKFT